AGYLSSNQIHDDSAIAVISANCVPHLPRNVIAHSFLPQKFNVLFPRQGDQNADSSRETFFQEPLRRRMINTQQVQTDLAHHAKIDIQLLRPAETVPFFVGLERAIGRALNEELAVAFEKEFRNRANSRIG